MRPGSPSSAMVLCWAGASRTSPEVRTRTDSASSGQPPARPMPAKASAYSSGPLTSARAAPPRSMSATAGICMTSTAMPLTV